MNSADKLIRHRSPKLRCFVATPTWPKVGPTGDGHGRKWAVLAGPSPPPVAQDLSDAVTEPLPPELTPAPLAMSPSAWRITFHASVSPQLAIFTPDAESENSILTARTILNPEIKKSGATEIYLPQSFHPPHAKPNASFQSNLIIEFKINQTGYEAARCL